MTAWRSFLNRTNGPDDFRWDNLITPGVFLAITFLIVMIPLERSGWNVTSTVNFLAFFGTFVAIFAIFAHSPSKEINESLAERSVVVQIPCVRGHFDV